MSYRSELPVLGDMIISPMVFRRFLPMQFLQAISIWKYSETGEQFIEWFANRKRIVVSHTSKGRDVIEGLQVGDLFQVTDPYAGTLKCLYVGNNKSITYLLAEEYSNAYGALCQAMYDVEKSQRLNTVTLNRETPIRRSCCYASDAYVHYNRSSNYSAKTLEYMRDFFNKRINDVDLAEARGLHDEAEIYRSIGWDGSSNHAGAFYLFFMRSRFYAAAQTGQVAANLEGFKAYEAKVLETCKNPSSLEYACSNISYVLNNPDISNYESMMRLLNSGLNDWVKTNGIGKGLPPVIRFKEAYKLYKAQVTPSTVSSSTPAEDTPTVPEEAKMALQWIFKSEASIKAFANTEVTTATYASVQHFVYEWFDKYDEAAPAMLDNDADRRKARVLLKTVQQINERVLQFAKVQQFKSDMAKRQY